MIQVERRRGKKVFGALSQTHKTKDKGARNMKQKHNMTCRYKETTSLHNMETNKKQSLTVHEEVTCNCIPQRYQGHTCPKEAVLCPTCSLHSDVNSRTPLRLRATESPCIWSSQQSQSHSQVRPSFSSEVQRGHPPPTSSELFTTLFSRSFRLNISSPDMV